MKSEFDKKPPIPIQSNFPQGIHQQNIENMSIDNNTNKTFQTPSLHSHGITHPANPLPSTVESEEYCQPVYKPVEVSPPNIEEELNAILNSKSAENLQQMEANSMELDTIYYGIILCLNLFRPYSGSRTLFQIWSA